MNTAPPQLVSEIKIHRKLAHVNVVRLREYLENEQFAIIILDLCADKVRARVVATRTNT